MTTAALISAGVAAASAAASAYNRNKARQEELENYNNARSYLDSLYYRDPLTTVGNKSLIKTAKKTYADNLDAIQNRSIAGGATMENQLAARQANNESLDKVYGQLLLGEDARRDRITAQKMQLDSQHSQNIQNGFRQAAQDWQQWGTQTAQAALAYGSSNLLGGSGAVEEAASGVTFGDLNTPIIGQVDTSAVKAPGAVAPGGLRGPGLDLSKSAVGNPFPYTPD